MKNILISFSGGLTSAFMTHYIIKNYPNSNILIVFANTGKEREETLQFINDCAKNWNINVHWIEYFHINKHGFKNYFKKVNFKTASRKGEPFENFIKRIRLPNSAYPSCSLHLKMYPIHNYAKKYFGNKNYYTAIGIRWDEKHRVNWTVAKEKKYFYPLVTDFPINKEYVHSFWESQNFTLGIKSYEGNCDCCWKKSKRKLYTIAKENEHLFDWWAEMEKKYGKGYSFYRNNATAEDIINESKSLNDKNKSICDTKISKLKQQQLSFFDLDNETSCNCQY